MIMPPVMSRSSIGCTSPVSVIRRDPAPRPRIAYILIYFLLTIRIAKALQYTSEESPDMLELRSTVVELRERIAEIMVRL